MAIFAFIWLNSFFIRKKKADKSFELLSACLCVHIYLRRKRFHMKNVYKSNTQNSQVTIQNIVPDEINNKKAYFSFDYKKVFGIQAAFFLNHLVFWLRLNKNKGQNFYKDRVWTYMTIKDIAIKLDLTYRQVDYMVGKLVKTGYLLRDCNNKKKYDKTSWYSVNEEWTKINDESILTQAFNKIVDPIPDKEFNNKIDNKTCNLRLQSNAAVLNEWGDNGRVEYLYQTYYPRKRNRMQGMLYLMNRLKEEKDFKQFENAIISYNKYCHDNKVKKCHILCFENFVRQIDKWATYEPTSKQIAPQAFESGVSDGFTKDQVKQIKIKLEEAIRFPVKDFSKIIGDYRQFMLHEEGSYKYDYLEQVKGINSRNKDLHFYMLRVEKFMKIYWRENNYTFEMVQKDIYTICMRMGEIEKRNRRLILIE